MAWSSMNGQNSSAAPLCEHGMLHLHPLDVRTMHRYRHFLVTLRLHTYLACYVPAAVMYAAHKRRGDSEQQRLHIGVSHSQNTGEKCIWLCCR